jgi:putative holliday junction resolvase
LPGRILGLDYGSRRIGVAVSDPLGIIARPVGFIENIPDRLLSIKKLILEYEITSIVVGMPLNLKGEHGQKAIETEEFCISLERDCNLPVVRCDERFTSKMSQQTLRMMEVKKKTREKKGTIDSMAAALILQGYLDSR